MILLHSGKMQTLLVPSNEVVHILDILQEEREEVTLEAASVFQLDKKVKNIAHE